MDEFHLEFKAKPKPKKKDDSKKSFFGTIVVIVLGICFIVHCLTKYGYNFNLSLEKDRAVISANNDSQ